MFCNLKRQVKPLPLEAVASVIALADAVPATNAPPTPYDKPAVVQACPSGVEPDAVNTLDDKSTDNCPRLALLLLKS